MKFARFIQLSLLLLFSVSILGCEPTTAEPEHSKTSVPRIIISGLRDGQLLEQSNVTIQYGLVPAAKGNIAVLYIDNGDPQLLPELAGEYELTGLEPGVHALQIKEMSADFVDTGYFDQVNFIVQ
ncbi:MAG: hypothetical protein COC05_03725 [Gammaproteobacteria bacterium]|nr:MAG: hypothetical protein COC05_03725 [Gammaproteobacteria bacterium]